MRTDSVDDSPRAKELQEVCTGKRTVGIFLLRGLVNAPISFFDLRARSRGAITKPHLNMEMGAGKRKSYSDISDVLMRRRHFQVMVASSHAHASPSVQLLPFDR